MRYKDVAKSLPEIACELNVDAVLEGSALLVGKRVRLTVQLVMARTDETLWAERYDRELEDLLGLQSELAETVVREIAIQISPSEATKLANRDGQPRSASRVPEESPLVLSWIARGDGGGASPRTAFAGARPNFRAGVDSARRLPDFPFNPGNGAAG